MRCRTAAECASTIRTYRRPRGSHRRVELAQRAFFSLPSHTTKTIGMTLTKAGRRLVAHRHRVPATLAITTIAPSGRMHTHAFPFTLR